MIPGTERMAQTLINAEDRFINEVIEQFGKTKTEAVKVLNEYRKAKVVKLDPVNGQFTLKHGAFWESDVIQNAIDV